MMPKQLSNLVRQIAVIGVVIATIVVNVLANTLPLNGVTTGEVAARFDVLFSPAPYTFAIWWLIYAGLVAYAIYQARPAVRGDKRLRSLDAPVIVSAAANIGWLLLWHHGQIVGSFAVMLVLLGALVVIYRRLTPERAFVTAGRRWAVHHVFSMYLGWITIASLANLAVTLDYLQRGLQFGLGDLLGFTLAVLTVLAVAGLVAWRHADVVYLLTLTWALIGLGVEHQREPVLAAVAWLAVAAVAVMVALSAVQPD